MRYDHSRFQSSRVAIAGVGKKSLLLSNSLANLGIMKQLIHLSFLALAVSSCSSDSLAPVDEFAIAKSEIEVTVTRYQYDGICPEGCYGDAGQPVFFVSNAVVNLKEGIVQDTLDFSSSIYSDLTGREGTVLIEDLEPGQYTIKVATQFGNKYRTVYTQLHKRAFIDFSF
jgi:hypothetical protein